jgi:hypothetical protein
MAIQSKQWQALMKNQYYKIKIIKILQKENLFSIKTEKSGFSKKLDFSYVSGRRDLNPRPHGPEPCALAGLSHTPHFCSNQPDQDCTELSLKMLSASLDVQRILSPLE